jgi:hypothetical protein
MSVDINFYISEDGPLSTIDPLLLHGLKVNDGKLDIFCPHLNVTGLSKMELEIIR